MLANRQFLLGARSLAYQLLIKPHPSSVTRQRAAVRPSGARALPVPARNALLADVVPPGAYGRAYGFERAMDNLGAIGGPLLAPRPGAPVGGGRAHPAPLIPGVLGA